MQMDKQTENIQQGSQSMDNQTINNMYRLTKIQKDRQTKLQTDRQTNKNSYSVIDTWTD